MLEAMADRFCVLKFPTRVILQTPCALSNPICVAYVFYTNIISTKHCKSMATAAKL
jgi:hypothetical protein